MNSFPVSLEAEPVSGGVVLRVVGTAATAFDAAFSLEVAAGSNRSIHQGRAALSPGETVVLSAVSASTGPDGAWHVVLRVDPSAGEQYEQVEFSS